MILDMVDLGYSWIALTQSDKAPGYTRIWGLSLPTEDDAQAALHDAMRSNGR